MILPSPMFHCRGPAAMAAGRREAAGVQRLCCNSNRLRSTQHLFVEADINDGDGRCGARLPVATMMSKNLPQMPDQPAAGGVCVILRVKTAASCARAGLLTATALLAACASQTDGPAPAASSTAKLSDVFATPDWAKFTGSSNKPLVQRTVTPNDLIGADSDLAADPRRRPRRRRRDQILAGRHTEESKCTHRVGERGCVLEAIGKRELECFGSRIGRCDQPQANVRRGPASGRDDAGDARRRLGRRSCRGC